MKILNRINFLQIIILVICVIFIIAGTFWGVGRFVYETVSSNNDTGNLPSIVALSNRLRSKLQTCEGCHKRDDLTAMLYEGYIEARYDFLFDMNKNDRLSESELTALKIVLEERVGGGI